MKNQVHDKNYEICGAKTRKGTPCLRPAGWGTNHPGIGRCKLHGGSSTGPKDQRNNKNAVKTGEYETIWFDTLDEEEKELFHQINLDKIKQLDNEIKLTEIRERRIWFPNVDFPCVSLHKVVFCRREFFVSYFKSIEHGFFFRTRF